MQVGDSLPDFGTLETSGADPVSLESMKGQRKVLFFYPRANTPGCTKEACAFRDLAAEFAKHDVHVYGVSKDSPKAQGNFREKYDLTMPLICDPERSLIDALGLFREKKMYGKTVQGVARVTLLVDADNKIEKIWDPVKVAGHAEAVLEEVAS